MKGQDIIKNITKAKMPDIEQVRENCKRQVFIQTRKSQQKIIFSASIATACFALALTFLLVFFLNGEGAVAYAVSISMPDGSSVMIEDSNIDYYDDPNRLTTTVSYVDNNPQLRFFITGEDIAKIEIITETESVRVQDFTQTLDEKFWNPELYYEETIINGTVYQYIPSRNVHFQLNEIVFPEEFDEYDQIWFTWLALNLNDWASEDSDTRIQGFDGMNVSDIEERYSQMTEEEKLAIASGGGRTSTAGHILLDGYPKELLNDRITIIITDRQGIITTRAIMVSISNNALGQTVVTAKTGT